MVTWMSVSVLNRPGSLRVCALALTIQRLSLEGEVFHSCCEREKDETERERDYLWEQDRELREAF